MMIHTGLIIRIRMHNCVKVSNKRTELITTSHDQDGFNYKQSEREDGKQNVFLL